MTTENKPIEFMLNGVMCHLTFAVSENATPQGWAKPEYLRAANWVPEVEGNLYMTEEELSESKQHSAAAGEHAAYQHIHGMLLKEAGDLFAAGKDDKANLVREVARKVGVFKEESGKKLQDHITRAMKR